MLILSKISRLNFSSSPPPAPKPSWPTLRSPCGPAANGRILSGRQVWRPLHRAPIPIILDEAVEEGFGTGVLKVTPAHDKTDYEIGKRHQLEFRDILTPDAKIHDPGEHDAIELNGLDRFAARKRAAEILNERGLLVKEEPYENTVGFSERAGVPIEPRLSRQWFMRYPNVPEALALLRNGHVKFHPAHWTKVYEHWLENIQDWCISRQVWWGHRIPVWSAPEMIEVPCDSPVPVKLNPIPADDMLCQIESPGEGWTQDPDTLDTWFSSWLWAYETMRLDDGTRQKFYPTSALVTGPDIIFLWVARMLIAGLHFKPKGHKETEEENARGESRLQGRLFHRPHPRSPGPQALEIARQFARPRSSSSPGMARTDSASAWSASRRRAPTSASTKSRSRRAATSAISSGTSAASAPFRGRSIRTPSRSSTGAPSSPTSCSTGSIFFSRATAMFSPRCRSLTSARPPPISTISSGTNSPPDLSRPPKSDFAQAGSPTREGTLATFDYVMSHVLRLLHPFAPFVTEELWCELGFGTETIQTTAWPVKSPRSKTWSPRAREIYQAADVGRTLRGEIKLPSNQKVPFSLVPSSRITPEHPFTDEQKAVLAAFLNASQVEVIDRPPADPGPKAFTQLGDLYLPATGLVDPAVEKDRLAKDLAKIEKDLEQTRRKLADANMLAKAPPAKIAEWRALESSLSEKEKSLRESLGRLE